MGNLPSGATVDPVKAKYPCDNVWAICQQCNDLQQVDQYAQLINNLQPSKNSLYTQYAHCPAGQQYARQVGQYAQLVGQYARPAEQRGAPSGQCLPCLQEVCHSHSPFHSSSYIIIIVGIRHHHPHHHCSSSSPSWSRKQEEQRVFIHNPPNMRRHH